MNVILSNERRTFTVDEYHKMAAAGIFGPDERIELIDGEVRRMNPIGPVHSFLTNRLRNLLYVAETGRTAIIRTGTPVHLEPDSEPEPDVLVLKWRADDYRVHPVPTDVLLLCEVSDSTLEHDQGDKRDLYAKHAIPEYWIVDVAGEQVIAYSQPADGVYGQTRTYGHGVMISPAALPHVQLAVADLFA